MGEIVGLPVVERVGVASYSASAVTGHDLTWRFLFPIRNYAFLSATCEICHIAC